MHKILIFGFCLMHFLSVSTQEDSAMVSINYLGKYIDSFIQKDYQRSTEQNTIRFIDNNTQRNISKFLQNSFLDKANAASFFVAYAHTRNVDAITVHNIIQALPESADEYDLDRD